MKKTLLLCVACAAFTGIHAQMNLDNTGRTTFQSGITVQNGESLPLLTLASTFTASSVSAPSIISVSSKQAGIQIMRNTYQGNLTSYITSQGTVYAKLGLLQSSDESRKENITSLTSSLSKVMALRGIRFDYTGSEENNSSASSPAPSTAPFRSQTHNAGANPQADETPAVDPEVWNQIQAEKNRQRIGLVAQEVEQVLPELVRTLPDGSKGIFYSDMTVVLVEAVKELQDSLSEQNIRIAQLEQRLETLEALLIPGSSQHAPMRSVSDVSETENENARAGLSQNRPNPFNRQTSIDYRLPAEAADCRICIYDLNGHQLSQFRLPGERTGTLTILASQFDPGIYLYSLIADGQEIDSKRMILTE